MRSIRLAVYLFVFFLHATYADVLPTYRMIDLGVFGTDYSHAISVNEKGQVLGACYENGCQFIFIWDKADGMKIIDLPNGCEVYPLNLKFNNKGQIAGTHSITDKAFLWDSNYGFIDIDLKELEMRHRREVEITAINDKGQILVRVDDQIFLWDQGKTTNLTDLFRKQVPGKWESFSANALNNHGHVVFSAYSNDKTKDGDPIGEKSFLWNTCLFTMIAPNIGDNRQIEVESIDDSGNMILRTWPSKGGRHNNLFISKSGNIISCSDRCNRIRNEFPIALDCLPGIYKKDRNGNFYFTNGVEIKKLFKEEHPYYNVANSTHIRDQNAKGYVVGTIGTIYSGCHHAFLAIPKKNKQ